MIEVTRHVLVPLPKVFGLDVSITNEVVLVWIAAGVTFVLLAAACRRRETVARGWARNLVETLIEFVEREIVQANLGRGDLTWAPFLLTLFFFILFANLLGLVPLPTHVKSATSNLNVTAALAVMVFVITLGINLRHHGPLGFLRRFLPAGFPLWLAIPMAPIEVVSWLARPVSLAVRLFANMMAGHYLIFIFVGMEMTAAWYLKAVPLLGAVAMAAFELFVCLIQAFVFTMLAGLYIRDAVSAD
jgi:F-type H+-transporting ATPase subunit a